MKKKIITNSVQLLITSILFVTLIIGCMEQDSKGDFNENNYSKKIIFGKASELNINRNQNNFAFLQEIRIVSKFLI